MGLSCTGGSISMVGFTNDGWGSRDLRSDDDSRQQVKCSLVESTSEIWWQGWLELSDHNNDGSIFHHSEVASNLCRGQ